MSTVCGDDVCSGDEDTAACCADCPCAEGTCNPVLNTCVTTICGDGTCDAGEGITCPEDCARCGNGACDEGESCCTDCGCFGDEVCDPLTVSCVTVTDEEILTFDHSAPAGADGTPPSAEEQEAHEREMKRTVEEVAALVTRARAGSGTATDTGELASQVSTMVERSVEASREVAALVTRARAGSGTAADTGELAIQVSSMVERSVEASREVASRRTVTVKDTSAGYRSTVGLEVENTGTTFRRDVRIVEIIPKDIAGDVSQLVFERQPDMVIKADPVVAWTVDIPPGETVALTYTVARDLRTVTSYERPVILVEEELCGNMACEPSEDTGTCPQDCPCGNGVCETERRCLTLTGGATMCQEPESCATCVADCGCEGPYICLEEQCIDASVCGDGVCSGDEDKATCCDDCGCPANEVCREGGCARVETAASGIPSVLLLAGILVLMMVTGALSSRSLRRGPAPEAPALLPDMDEVPAEAVAPAHKAIAVSAGVVIDEDGAAITARPLAVGEVLTEEVPTGVAIAVEAEQRAVGFTLAPEEQDLPPGFIDVLEADAVITDVDARADYVFAVVDNGTVMVWERGGTWAPVNLVRNVATGRAASSDMYYLYATSGDTGSVRIPDLVVETNTTSEVNLTSGGSMLTARFELTGSGNPLPRDIALDVGTDDIDDWSRAGVLSGPVTTCGLDADDASCADLFDDKTCGPGGDEYCSQKCSTCFVNATDLIKGTVLTELNNITSPFVVDHMRRLADNAMCDQNTRFCRRKALGEQPCTPGGEQLDAMGRNWRSDNCMSGVCDAGWGRCDNESMRGGWYLRGLDSIPAAEPEPTDLCDDIQGSGIVDAMRDMWCGDQNRVNTLLDVHFVANYTNVPCLRCPNLVPPAGPTMPPDYYGGGAEGEGTVVTQGETPIPEPAPEGLGSFNLSPYNTGIDALFPALVAVFLIGLHRLRV